MGVLTMAAIDEEEMDLATLVRAMNPCLMPEVYVFITLQHNDTVPSNLYQSSVSTFNEKEGKTFVLERSLVETLGYQFDYPCRMISLEVHSSLSAVGFLAIILRHLADHGISCNVASGYYHDHLFVQEGEEEQVLSLLQQLAQSVSNSSD